MFFPHDYSLARSPPCRTPSRAIKDRSEPLIRCIVHLSVGDPQRVSQYMRVAAEDYRDLIYWAECDKDDQKVRDFSVSFT